MLSAVRSMLARRCSTCESRSARRARSELSSVAMSQRCFGPSPCYSYHEYGHFVAGTTFAWRVLAHVPAKWTPVRRQEHAPLKDSRACPDSEGMGHTLGTKSDWLLARGIAAR